MAEWGLDIPLVGPPNANVDEVHLAQSSADIVDFVPVVVEGKIHLVKRAGLEPFIDLASAQPVNGLHWHDKERLVIAVVGNIVASIEDPSGTLGAFYVPSDLLPVGIATFAETATGVVIANGGPMVRVILDSAAVETLTDPQAPTAVTHVASIDQYLLANVAGTGQIQFSGVNDPGNWAALDVFSAESKFDPVVAIGEAYREIIALGRQSVEFFINDGQTPFSRLTGAALPFGTIAPYSLAMVGDTWMWLDHTKRLVVMKGRNVVPVSSPYDRLIQRLPSVNDAVGYSTFVDGRAVYLLNLPTAGMTIAYAQEANIWHKWGWWDMEHGRYDRFRGLSYCYASSWNLHLFGDHSNGIIYKAKADVFTDDGNPIRSLLRTGHISHGTSGMKRSDAIRLACKRGAGNANVADPQISMRRRVDNGRWTQERLKSLGRVGQHKPFIDWRRNGKYKTCQYEFVHADDSDCQIMGAQEQVTPLTR